MKDEVQLQENILSKANVVGFRKKITKKQVKGNPTEDDCIRVYVSGKKPVTHLAVEDVLPTEIDGLKVDIFDLGGKPSIHTVAHPERYRPIVPGCSIGSFSKPTGTFGWVASKDGKLWVDSCAHVFAKYPHRESPISPIILQPGRVDGGKFFDDFLSLYEWHEPVKPKYPIHDYPLSPWNRFKKRLGLLKEPEVPDGWVPPLNYQDYAVAKLQKPVDDTVELRTLDFEVLGEYDLVGKVMAGTMLTSVVCKVKYQQKAGYDPYMVDVAEIHEDDYLGKSGRTTGFKTHWTIDDSAQLTVDYGYMDAVFDDVAITWCISQPGDSGASVWKKRDW